nr:hypothetical protein 14 [Piscirickettsiaceae bacterium]
MLQKRFSNEFLDNLIADVNPPEQVRLLRVFGTGLSRKEIASFLNIDPHSIRRYESEWNTAPVPTWYFHILRFLSGDLSIYGPLWINTKIKLSNQTISTPFDKYNEYTPMDLNTRYSYIYKANENKIKKLEKEVEDLTKEIFRLKSELKQRNSLNSDNVIEFKQR